MVYWWERYDTNPDANTSSPPDGAPEDHFPDQVNNIQRQNMAAVSEIGEKVLGPGDGSAPPQAATSISGPFLKLVYDALLPVNTIMAWDSKQGAAAFPVPNFPEFSSVDWQQCDAAGGGGAPDLSLQAISGANSIVGPGQSFTGDQKAAVDMLPAGGFTPAGSISGTRLDIEQIPPHPHDIDDPGHFHLIDQDREPEGGGGNVNIVENILSPPPNADRETAPAFTNITVENAGGELPGETQAKEHGHNFTGNSELDHIHTAGSPASAALEYYIRVA